MSIAGEGQPLITSSTARTGTAREQPAWADLLAALRRDQRATGVVGVSGAVRGQMAVQLTRATGRPVLVLTATDDEAEAVCRDARFFAGWGAQPLPASAILRLPADDLSPYDGLTPDRSVQMQRLRVLFQLHVVGGARVVVASAAAFSRRVLPPAELSRRSEVLVREQEWPIDRLRRVLVSAGYESVPLVEDPGTFSIRGGIVDLYTPSQERPARLEYFGDWIESIRLFDPESQRTVGELQALEVVPVRETLLNDDTLARAIDCIHRVANQVDRPSSKVFEFIDELREGRQAFGLHQISPGLFQEGLRPVWEYLPARALVVVDDPLAVLRAIDTLDDDERRGFSGARARGELVLEPDAYRVSPEELLKWIEGGTRVEWQHLDLSGFRPGPDDVDSARIRDDIDPSMPVGGSTGVLRRPSGGVGQAPIAARFSYPSVGGLREEIASHHAESGALEPLCRRLAEWRAAGVAAVCVCQTLGQADKLRHLLLGRNVMARVVPAPLPDSLAQLYQVATFAHIVVGELSAGFVDPAGGYALVAESDLFGERTGRTTRSSRSDRPFAAALRDLTEGDLVVHAEHGIARYDGLTRLQVRGVEQDFLVLAFAGRDKLYLPVHRLRLVQKYVGGEPDKVRLDNLQGNAFQKRRQRVKEELLQMAAELLDIYAARRAHPGHSYSPPDALYRQFEQDFEFQETPDQEKAIAETLADMQQREPMDRLVCGDVGFGKTEVAMRAAFKAVEDHKQVAVLVPTTVLAAQHVRTFRKRMADYPVSIELVSRFHDARHTRDTLKRLAEGKVDIVVGTHRLLSADVDFKDLGLVIIDEEHRFGVKHKEALKRYRKSVDVLTLSATPIPRTLHMSLSGIRDLSIIATPPTDRRAIRTFVAKYDPAILKEAIDRELARGGQVYLLHNRVDSIDGLRQTVQELCPQARAVVAHGQMADGELERVMTAFVERQFDVLVCTTIIESGLDIPSANTMIVDRADTFGLAQLYQIRGRVGRGKERAYCYLLVPAARPVTADARKRLQVLQQFTELGAGFHIASHDMEIRGAGNLLGPDQSGQIEAVGFDLYAELLDEAVRELRGEPPRTEYDPEVTLPVPAFLPDTYIPDVPQRISFYKRLAGAASEDELLDARAELVDRFGELPPEAECLLELMRVKADMRRLRLRALESGPGRLVVTLGHDASIDPLRMAQLVARSKEGLRLTPDMKLVMPVLAPPGAVVDLLAESRRMLKALLAAR